MPLFDLTARSDLEFARRSEGAFAYLNRSGRPQSGAVRDLLEDWFARYPAAHQEELRARLRSRTRHHFDSAFFELYVHALLTRCGCSVTVHPHAPDGRARRPDFLAAAADGSRFFVEAVVVSDRSAQQAAADARAGEFLDALEDLSSADFFVGVRPEGEPKSPIPKRRWLGEVRRFLASVNPDDAALREDRELDQHPHIDLEHDGWTVRVFAVLKQRSRGERSQRGLGMELGEAMLVDPRTPLRDALVGKANRYGDLGLPFIVAANAKSEHLDQIDVMEALFGKEQLVMTHRGDPGRLTRKPDGAWTSGRGPRNKRVSAALVAPGIVPWSVAAYTPQLYLNPWASHSAVSLLTELPRMVPVEARMVSQPGRSARELFVLPDGWPRLGGAA